MAFLPIVIIETIVVIVLLGLFISAKAKISQLQKDNRELLRRLKLLSKSKIVD